MSVIHSNISAQHTEVMARLARAAKRANRATNEITLVAVSKVQPDERIAAMLATGHKVYGENRVQEAQGRWGGDERFSSRRSDIELRLIGPLQSNKTQEAVQLFDVIETVDREKLLRTFVKVRDSLGIKLPKGSMCRSIRGRSHKNLVCCLKI